jgi:hypothetical protein
MLQIFRQSLLALRRIAVPNSRSDRSIRCRHVPQSAPRQHAFRFLPSFLNCGMIRSCSPIRRARCPLHRGPALRPIALGGAEAGHLGHRLTSRNFSSISSYLSLFHLRRNLARCSNLRLVSLHPIRFTSTAGHCERHRPWSRLPSLHTLFAPVVSPSCGGGSPWSGCLLSSASNTRH